LLTWQATFCRHLGKTTRAGELLHQGLKQLELLAGQERAALQAPLLLELGRLASETDRAQAIQLVQQSLRFYELLGDQHGMASAYFELGEIARQQGNLDEARRLAATSLRLYETFQDARGIADALLVLNYITMDQGELGEAERLVRQRIALYRQIGDRAGLGNAYRILGHLLRYRGEYSESMRWFDESLAIFTDLGDRREMAIGRAYQAIPHVALGNYAEAKACGEQALSLGQESNSPFALAIVQVLLGTVALATAHYAEAGQYLRTSMVIFNGLSERNLAGQALAWLGYAELGMGDLVQAQKVLVEALQIANTLAMQMPIMIALPALVLLMAAQGKTVRASELYALAMRYPIIATAQFVTDVVGAQMTQIARSLPPEVRTSAEERGRSLDLAATVAELIAEVGTDGGSVDPSALIA
jgi:tetratricopeptide (TPR) repeat protein